MTRAERKVAAREALARLWAAGHKIDDVAAALGVDRRRVSELNSGSGRTPSHPELWRLQTLGQEPELRELVARIVERPTEVDVFDFSELVLAEPCPFTEGQIAAVSHALSRTMPRSLGVQ